MSKLGILVLSFLILGGCKDNGSTLQPLPAVFRVDLQAQFLNDSVLVLIDGMSAFEGRVTTNYSQGLARSVPVNASAGRHEVRVKVVHPYTGTEKDTIVTVKDTMTVTVRLDERSRTLYFDVYPFLIPYR